MKRLATAKDIETAYRAVDRVLQPRVGADEDVRVAAGALKLLRLYAREGLGLNERPKS